MNFKFDDHEKTEDKMDAVHNSANEKQKSEPQGNKRKRRRRGKLKIRQYILAGVIATGTLIVSIISAIHLFELFGLGNNPEMSGALAGAFEYLTIVGIVSFFEIQRLSSWSQVFLWAILIFLVLMQILGNVYGIFAFIMSNQARLSVASQLFGRELNVMFFRSIAILLGVPLSVISTLFVKILAEYVISIQGGKKKKAGGI